MAAGDGDVDFLDIVIDDSNNTHVTGILSGSATFGPGEINETTLNSSAFDDIFIAKYDSNGNLFWAKSAGGTMGDIATGIAVDGSGNSFVTGRFWNEMTFGQGENILTLIGSRFQDIFLAKYNTNGGTVWAKSALGSSYGQNLPYDIAIDAFGNSYVTGIFFWEAIFVAGEANETTLYFLCLKVFNPSDCFGITDFS
jgi:hypothetical protein